MKRHPEKYATNPQENNHAEVRPQQSRRAALVTLQRGRSPTNPPHKFPKTPFHKSIPKGLHPRIFENPN